MWFNNKFNTGISQLQENNWEENLELYLKALQDEK